MKSNALDLFWQMFYMRGIEDREQILLEAVRVILTYRQLKNQQEQISDTPEDKERLFAAMQKVSEAHDLGHFPGDREFFYNLYGVADELNLVDVLVISSKNDRSGMLAPAYLVDYLAGAVQGSDGRILIAEAEKFAAGLQKMIAAHPQSKFTLTTEKRVYYLLLTAAFAERPNVKVVNQSIYRELLEKKSYDRLIAIPSFGSRYSPEDTGKGFITRDSECIAAENLIRHLSDRGELTVVLPAKVTFAGGPVQEFRKWMMGKYHVEALYSLPEGTFRPYASIKTYLMIFNRNGKTGVTVGNIKDNGYALVAEQKRQIPDAQFQQHDDWRLELFLADDNEAIQKFKASELEKIKLKDVADIFRGKSVLKDDVQPGKVRVLNISNMEDGELHFEGMDTINEEERKVKRYQLETNDILLTCRGTMNKVGIFPETKHVVIASANIIVVRIREKVWPLYLKIFFDSPIGQLLIQGFQRGTTVMNINPGDIGELEIPLLPLDRQQQLARDFIKARERYQRKRAEIERQWEKESSDLYNNFLGGSENGGK